MSTRTNTRRIWAAPIALAAASAFGLIAALLADDLGDALSWAALATPVVIVLWYGLRPTKKR